jgi:hypothetical protein
MSTIELNASDLKVGCCVILNELEQPCSKLIAVVWKIESVLICRYLCDWDHLKPFFRNGVRSAVHEATTVGHFGVSVKFEDGRYWCEQSGESIATYDDGKPRYWQEEFGVKRTADVRVAYLALTGKAD